MNKKLILISVFSLSLAASPVAMARGDRDDDRQQHRQSSHQQDGRHDRDNDRRHHDDRDSQHDNRRGDRDHRNRSHDHHWQGERERYCQGDRHHISRYQRPRGYSHHHWRAGDQMPRSYRSSRYVVNDYYAYRLQAPPRHHHWVRVDNDVVLAVITTGVVTAVVYGIFQ